MYGKFSNWSRISPIDAASVTLSDTRVLASRHRIVHNKPAQEGQIRGTLVGMMPHGGRYLLIARLFAGKPHLNT